MSDNRHDPSPKAVYDAICDLAEELGVTPNLQMIADNLHCSRMHVSNMMTVLKYMDVIEWIDRYRYRVIDSEWFPPEQAKVI